MAILAAVIHYLTIVLLLLWLVVFILKPDPVVFILKSDLNIAYVLVGLMAVCILTWIVAYFKRRAALCPLCKGTPLLNSGALPHATAFRFGPFNHGVSAVLTILFTHHFRCMYCGSRYDLMRQPRDYRQLREGPVQSPSDDADH